MTVKIDSGTPETRNWPTREEWAKNRRTFFGQTYEQDMRRRVSNRAGDHAAPTEIAAIIPRLKQKWKELGRELKTAKAAAGILLQQPGEAGVEYFRRWKAMGEADQEQVSLHQTARFRRRRLNQAIKTLEEGNIPGRFELKDEDWLLLEPLASLYEAAYEKAREQLVREVETTPIDDAAWERELERRRRCDGRL